MEFAVIAVLVVLIGYQQYMLTIQAAKADARVESILARVGNAPQLVIREPEGRKPVVNPDEVKYVSDEPYHDEMWNDYRGEEPE